MPRFGTWNTHVSKWLVWKRLHHGHHRLPFCRVSLRWTPDSAENARQAAYREIYGELMELASEYRSALAAQAYASADWSGLEKDERRISAIAVERAAARFRGRKKLDE